MKIEKTTGIEAKAAEAQETLVRLSQEDGGDEEAYQSIADVIDRLQRHCQDQEQRCHNLDDEYLKVHEQTGDLAVKNKRLAEVTAKSAELYAELDEKNMALALANSEMAKSNAHAAELIGHLELKDAENTRLNAALAHANAYSAELMADLEKKNEQLQQSLTEIKTLKGIVPICAHCKQVRDDQGYWQMVEVYISKRSSVDFSHGVCPACTKEHYSEYLTDDEIDSLSK